MLLADFRRVPRSVPLPFKASFPLIVSFLLVSPRAAHHSVVTQFSLS